MTGLKLIPPVLIAYCAVAAVLVASLVESNRAALLDALLPSWEVDVLEWLLPLIAALLLPVYLYTSIRLSDVAARAARQASVLRKLLAAGCCANEADAAGSGGGVGALRSEAQVIQTELLAFVDEHMLEMGEDFNKERVISRQELGHRCLDRRDSMQQPAEEEEEEEEPFIVMPL